MRTVFAPPADIYKQGILAARLERSGNETRFSYVPDYLSSGRPAVASTLPLSDQPVTAGSGAVPAFFAGLLPEGRRLAALRRAVKTSADDELTMLIAAGADLVGDVQILPADAVPNDVGTATVVDNPGNLEFDKLRQGVGIDPAALAGVQDKVSAGMISLPVEAAGQRYILKLNPPEYPHVVENEYLMYRYARRLNIPLSHVRLLHDMSGEAGLLVQRFDRTTTEANVPARLAVEDASQVLGLYPADKYSPSYSSVCNALSGLCVAPVPAIRNLVVQAAFAWLSGNGDVHAKNISVLEDVSGETAIAPMYDIPSTVVYGDKTMALTIAAKRRGISAKHFLAWAVDIGLPEKAARSCIDIALKATSTLVDDLAAGASPFDAQLTREWIRELRNRRRLMQG